MRYLFSKIWLLQRFWPKNAQKEEAQLRSFHKQSVKENQRQPIGRSYLRQKRRVRRLPLIGIVIIMFMFSFERVFGGWFFCIFSPIIDTFLLLYHFWRINNREIVMHAPLLRVKWCPNDVQMNVHDLFLLPLQQVCFLSARTPAIRWSVRENWTNLFLLSCQNGCACSISHFFVAVMLSISRREEKRSITLHHTNFRRKIFWKGLQWLLSVRFLQWLFCLGHCWSIMRT